MSSGFEKIYMFSLAKRIAYNIIFDFKQVLPREIRIQFIPEFITVVCGVQQEADQLKRGIRRHLNYGAAIASKHTSYGTHETSNLCLPDSYKGSSNYRSMSIMQTPRESWLTLFW